MPIDLIIRKYFIFKKQSINLLIPLEMYPKKSIKSVHSDLNACKINRHFVYLTIED